MILAVPNDILDGHLQHDGACMGFPPIQQKTHNLFRAAENSTVQRCAAHVAHSCQQYCSALLHLIAG